jgi:hypothetical protein
MWINWTTTFSALDGFQPALNDVLLKVNSLYDSMGLHQIYIFQKAGTDRYLIVGANLFAHKNIRWH